MVWLMFDPDEKYERWNEQRFVRDKMALFQESANSAF